MYLVHVLFRFAFFDINKCVRTRAISDKDTPLLL